MKYKKEELFDMPTLEKLINLYNAKKIAYPISWNDAVRSNHGIEPPSPNMPHVGKNPRYSDISSLTRHFQMIILMTPGFCEKLCMLKTYSIPVLKKLMYHESVFSTAKSTKIAPRTVIGIYCGDIADPLIEHMLKLTTHFEVRV